MSFITPRDIQNLRCVNCDFHKYDPHKISTKQHRCTCNSNTGLRILSAEMNVASHTPDYCPYITAEEMAINKGTILAKKITRKEKKLAEAKQLCEELPHELEHLYKELEQILVSAQNR